MHTKRELVDIGPLTAQIIDTNLGIRNTTIKPGFRVGLVLAVTITSCGAAGHLD